MSEFFYISVLITEHIYYITTYLLRNIFVFIVLFFTCIVSSIFNFFIHFIFC